MNCPICKKTKLEKEIFHNVGVDYCPVCLGIWFDRNELRWAKDDKDKDLKWVDINLWKDQKDFKVSKGDRSMCPCCRVPLYEVYYGDSGIIIDVCNVCYGIWLDRKEFSKITDWLKKKADYDILHNYSKVLLEELGEVFTGPEPLREEIADFLIIMKIFNYKFLVRYPTISKIISSLSK
jgi:Zn-finger nucleic acid-binding protein